MASAQTLNVDDDGYSTMLDFGTDTVLFSSGSLFRMTNEDTGSGPILPDWVFNAQEIYGLHVAGTMYQPAPLVNVAGTPRLNYAASTGSAWTKCVCDGYATYGFTGYGDNAGWIVPRVKSPARLVQNLGFQRHGSIRQVALDVGYRATEARMVKRDLAVVDGLVLGQYNQPLFHFHRVLLAYAPGVALVQYQTWLPRNHIEDVDTDEIYSTPVIVEVDRFLLPRDMKIQFDAGPDVADIDWSSHLAVLVTSLADGSEHPQSDPLVRYIFPDAEGKPYISLDYSDVVVPTRSLEKTSDPASPTRVQRFIPYMIPSADTTNVPSFTFTLRDAEESL